MIRNQPNAATATAAAAAASNSSVPARSYWTSQAGAPGSCGGAPAEPEVRRSSSAAPKQSTLPPIVMQAVIGVNFIADHLKQQDEFNKVIVSYFASLLVVLKPVASLGGRTRGRTAPGDTIRGGGDTLMKV